MMMVAQEEGAQSPDQSAPPGFDYSIGRTITDNQPEQRRAPTWAEFAAVFASPDGERSTEKGGRYLCGPMHFGQPDDKPHAAHWRAEKQAEPSAWLAFDFDKLTPENLPRLTGWFGKHYRCLWYHTASSKPVAPRIRIVVALDRAVTPAERAQICRAIGAHLGPDFPRDPSQDRASQPLYLPLVGAVVTRHDDLPPMRADLWLEQPVTEQHTPPTAKAAPGCAVTHEAERARAALQSLDPNCPREDWVRIGMAFKAAGGSFEAWHAWSAAAGNYGGEQDCRAVWNSMKGQGIGPGTLFAAAQAAGWQDPARASVREAFGLPPPQRFRLTTPAELAALPPVRWRIRGVLPEAGIAAVYSPPGSGKSFVVLDMLAAVAVGRPWFGCRTKAAPVLYIGLEGEAGIAQRVKALQARHGAPDRMRFFFLLAPLDLRQPADRAAIISAARAAGLTGGVVCIDTLAASAPGMDENTSADMGEVIAVLKELQAALGGVVLVVHHTGKDAAKGLRGHSSLLGALDCAIEVSRTDDRREWRTAKAKDGRDGDAHPFRLEVVGLGTDDEGEPITSCVVVPEQTAADAVRRPPPPKAGNQRIIYDALRKILPVAGGISPEGSPAPAGKPSMPLEAAIEATRANLVCEPKRQTERTQKALQGLITRGNVMHQGGWIWLP